jgi:NSS family neurotransmitter:Na+ symporter
MVERFGQKRQNAAAGMGLLIWLLGFGTIFSFNVLADFSFYKGTIFANIDHITSNIMLPLGGLLITVFAAWVMCRNSSSEELGGVGGIYKLWRFLAKYVAPIAIVFIFLKAIGLLELPGN